MLTCKINDIYIGNKNIKKLYNKINVQFKIDKETAKRIKHILSSNNIKCKDNVIQYLLSDICDINNEYDKFICIMNIIVDICMLTSE